jgi:hypothetical protein
MKYKPRIGTDFPISKDEVVAKTRQITEFTRSTIALTFVLLAGLALAVTAIFCVYKGEFVILQTLWAVLAAPLCLIIGYYFRGSNIDEKNDESTA